MQRVRERKREREKGVEMGGRSQNMNEGVVMVVVGRDGMGDGME